MATATAGKIQPLTDLNTKYVYVLAQENDHRGRIYDFESGERLPDPKHKPRRNLLLKCHIIWDGSKDPFTGEERPAGKYLLRYYDGCATLFADSQPQDKATIDELIANTREVIFQHGYAEVYGYDTMMKKYFDMASWNGASPYRVPTAEMVYLPVDAEQSRVLESSNLDELEMAMDYAKKADVKRMRTHARFLGIAFEDSITSNPITDTALRTEYRKAAKENPKNFLSTYNDKTIQLKTWIEDAMQTGAISTTMISNKAVWSKKGVEICDISGLKSTEGILNKLIEFSQLPEGSDFLEALNIIYK